MQVFCLVSWMVCTECSDPHLSLPLTKSASLDQVPSRGSHWNVAFFRSPLPLSFQSKSDHSHTTEFFGKVIKGTDRWHQFICRCLESSQIIFAPALLIWVTVTHLVGSCCDPPLPSSGPQENIFPFRPSSQQQQRCAKLSSWIWLSDCLLRCQVLDQLFRAWNCYIQNLTDT